MTSPSDTLTGGALRDVLALRQVTADLIAQEGRAVALIRPAAAISDGAGGRVAPGTAATTLTPVQRFLTISLYEPLDLSDAEGDGLHYKFILIGLYNDDIRKGDSFMWQSTKYVVNFVHADHTYQCKAEGEAVYGG